MFYYALTIIYKTVPKAGGGIIHKNSVFLRRIKVKLKRINCNLGCRALWIISPDHLIENFFSTHAFLIQDQNNYSQVNASKMCFY